MSTPARLLVLVIDPSKHQQEVERCLLEPYCRVIGASSLTEANSLMGFYLPTLVLVELNQPDGDGIAWIREVRHDATWDSMGIGCVTERSSVRDKVASFQAGADSYIVKPLIEDTFLARIILLQRIRAVMHAPHTK